MKPTEHSFTSWDETNLFYRAWLPNHGVTRALLLFHRGHEHSGRWQETVESLGLDDSAIFAWDARGHGRSPGQRGAAGRLLDVIKDVQSFVSHVSEQHGIATEDIIVLAHSLAAVTVAAWVHDYAPPIRAMILATPAFRVRLYVPCAVPALRTFRPSFVKSYVKAGMLTHDRAEAARYNEDPLIFRQIAVNLLLDLHDTGRRLVSDAGAIYTPTLIISAGRDFVVSLKAQRQFFDRLSSPIKRMEILPEAFHSIFHEQRRGEVVELVRRFVRERFAESPARPTLLHADRAGYTHDEYQRLQNGRSLKFVVAQTGLKTVGRLSHGVALGWQSGFDSGLSLDYVYRNKAGGRAILGRLIDRSYLNSIGWRGIRQRKTNLQRVLQQAIARLHDQGRLVRILDVAAGGGRYVLETMVSLRRIPMTALLRDYRAENVRAARTLADEFGLTNVTVEQGDAFDPASLDAISPRPNVAIVSGLYELFAANDLVLYSLGGLAGIIEPGGYLIYTNQPWHPQVEFIAKVLRNHRGRPWVMRRRTTTEMDELVRVAGFEKVEMEVDQWGMFTVSLARKVDRPLRGRC